MSDKPAVVIAAEQFAAKEEDSLELLIGLQEAAIAKNPVLAEVPDLDPKYDGPHMGLIDDLKAVGKRIALRWAKELHALVCDKGNEDKEDRQKILDAFNLGETAVIGAVAAALIGLSVPPPIAAAAAALIVKRFIWPARDELCDAWGEAMKA